ncbi:MAG: hypothetical protein ACYTEZ_15675 [Planctomycetota bacterium]|jgi:hypothetical protein
MRIFLLVAFTSLAACQTSPGKPRRLIDRIEDARISERELRLRVLEYARDFSAAVEAATQEILLEAPDSMTRRRAMLWRMSVVSACQSAAIHDDAAAALLDVWALAVQMRQYLEEGDGQGIFGPFQPVVVSAARRLEQEVNRLADSVPGSGEATQGRERVYAWVAEHPMRGPLFARATTTAEAASLTRDTALGTFGAVRKMEEHLGDLGERLSFYVEHLPRQARWQAAYLLLELMHTEQVTLALADVDRLTVSAERIQKRVDELPELVTREREAVLEALRGERKALMIEGRTLVEAERETLLKEVETMRRATLDAVRAEREATLEGIDGQRLATLDVLQEEREIVLAAIREERLATMEQVDAITQGAVENAATRFEGLMGHLLWRSLPLGGAAFALLLLVVFLTRRPR